MLIDADKSPSSNCRSTIICKKIPHLLNEVRYILND